MLASITSLVTSLLMPLAALPVTRNWMAGNRMMTHGGIRWLHLLVLVITYNHNAKLVSTMAVLLQLRNDNTVHLCTQPQAYSVIDYADCSHD